MTLLMGANTDDIWFKYFTVTIRMGYRFVQFVICIALCTPILETDSLELRFDWRIPIVLTAIPALGWPIGQVIMLLSCSDFLPEPDFVLSLSDDASAYAIYEYTQACSDTFPTIYFWTMRNG